MTVGTSARMTDLLGSIVLYKTPGDSALHANRLGCESTDGRAHREQDQVTLGAVLGVDVRDAPAYLHTCGAKMCGGTSTNIKLESVAQGVRYHAQVQDLEVGDDPLGELRLLAGTRRAMLDLHTETKKPQQSFQSMTQTINLVHELVNKDTTERLIKMGQRDWMERLRDTAPAWAELGNDGGGALGIMVGPREVAEGGSIGDVLVEILDGKRGPKGQVVLLVAPLVVLGWTADRRSMHGAGPTRGWKRQVMRLPEGLTSDALETIVGLYAPGETGAMGDLPSVVEAALRLQ